MNIQIGKVPPPSDGATATRATPLSGSHTSDGTDNAVAAPHTAPPKAQPPAAQSTSIESAKQVARQINDFLRSASSDVQFEVDNESSEVVVRVVDSQTKQVIRQMPSEEMIAISKSLDKMTGLLVQQKA